MKAITLESFSQWLEIYGKASRENNVKASSELFSQGAKYYETPFSDPLIGREAIYGYWLTGAQTLKDKESSFQVLALRNNLGIARWVSKFTTSNSDKRFALDCVFLVEFDENNKCTVFREWWHIQEIQD
jgi:hypothetical protein